MIVENKRIKTYVKNEKTVTNASSCKTVNSHKILTTCQENYKRSFRENISKQFQTGKKKTKYINKK